MEKENIVLWKKEDLNWEHWHPIEPEVSGLDRRVWVCSGGCPDPSNYIITVRYEINENEFMIVTVEDEPRIIEPEENNENDE
jgi:hypothetical protein